MTSAALSPAPAVAPPRLPAGVYWRACRFGGGHVLIALDPEGRELARRTFRRYEQAAPLAVALWQVLRAANATRLVTAPSLAPAATVRATLERRNP